MGNYLWDSLLFEKDSKAIKKKLKKDQLAIDSPKDAWAMTGAEANSMLPTGIELAHPTADGRERPLPLHTRPTTVTRDRPLWALMQRTQ